MPANTWVDAAGGFPDPTSSTAFYDAMNALSQAVQAANPSYVAPTWAKPTTGTPVSAAWMNALEQRATGTGLATAPSPSGGDDTAALQNWLNALTGPTTATMRPGTYKLSGTLIIPTGVTVIAYGAVFAALAGTGNGIQLGDRATIYGGEIDMTLRTGSANGIVTAAGGGQKITDLYVHDSPAGGVAIQNATDWLVEGCRIVNTASAGISATFANRGRIANNEMYNAHGVQWWGGDSKTVTLPGIFAITVTGNFIYNGAIWGSCGQNIAVAGNVIDTAADVGIDFEGCWDCSATGNTVRNAVNAGLSVFYGSKRVTFSGNIVANDASGNIGAGFKAYTSTTNSQINVIGNVFTTNSTAIATDDGALRDSTITGNRVSILSTGVAYAVRFLDCNNLAITNNTVTTHAPMGISHEGGIACRIEGNLITTDTDTSTSGAASAGIYLYWRSAANPCKRNQVRNNVVKGFVQSIFDNCWGDMASYNLIENNVAAVIHYHNGTGYTGVVNNNRNDSFHALVTASAV